MLGFLLNLGYKIKDVDKQMFIESTEYAVKHTDIYCAP
jgi:hypothetical protein